MPGRRSSGAGLTEVGYVCSTRPSSSHPPVDPSLPWARPSSAAFPPTAPRSTPTSASPAYPWGRTDLPLVHATAPGERCLTVTALLCNEVHSKIVRMALEHAILVSLLEKPGSGYELARRFERSIGYFWTATHQQIYRVLKRMENDGWIDAREVPQHGRPDKKAYSVADLGRAALTSWLHDPIEPETVRSETSLIE